MKYLIPLFFLLGASCGEEEAACVVAYDTCAGGNPCEPICVREDAIPDCGETECPQPNDEPGSCEEFTGECTWR